MLDIGPLERAHLESVHDGDRRNGHYELITPSDLAKIEIFRQMIKSEKIALDLGCGGGHCASALSKVGGVMGIDSSRAALEVAKKNAKTYELILGDAQELPFKEGSFDLVLAKDIFEHIRNDIKAIGELGKVSKPGARLLIYVPYDLNVVNFSTEYLLKRLTGYSIDRWVKHLRRYDVLSITELLKKGDFSISKKTHFAHFLNSTIVLLCLVGYQLFHGLKLTKGRSEFIRSVAEIVRLLCLLEYELMKKMPGAGLFVIADKPY